MSIPIGGVKTGATESRTAGSSILATPWTRRRLLHVTGEAGAFIAVTAVGGGALRAVDQGVFATGEGPAYATWESWRAGGDGPFNLVRAAVLAANGHNTQPWLFGVEPDRIDLFFDTTRAAGALDPLNREACISLGCALENLLLAAGPNGFAATPALLPDPTDATHVARVDLLPGPPADSPLYDAIPRRHTNRAAYTSAPVADETLTAMADLNDVSDLSIVWFVTPEEKRAFGDLTIQATEAIVADTEQSVDSFRWWQGDWDELQRHKDGITLDATGLPPLTRSLGKLLPDISRAESDESWLKRTRDPHVSTAAAFGLVVARDHQDPAQRLQAGRLYQRLHLWATAEGLAMQPLHQTVERRDRELALGLAPEIGEALAGLMPDPAWQTVMPFRIGHPEEKALKSPRRPAADVILA